MRLPTGGRDLLLRYEQVRASVPRPELTGVPGSPPWLVGAWNHHGQAVAVIDLCALSAAAERLREAGWIILVEGARGVFGVLADGPAAEATVRPPERPAAVATPLPEGLWIDLDRVCDAMDHTLDPSSPVEA